MESLQQTMRDKQEETRQQAASLKPILKLVIEKTKELQAEVGSAFLRLYSLLSNSYS